MLVRILNLKLIKFYLDVMGKMKNKKHNKKIMNLLVKTYR
jgi:hypothetical protein